MHLMSQDQMKVLIAMTLKKSLILKYLTAIIINYTKTKPMVAANGQY